MDRINIWTHGLCSVFAVALQRRIGGDLYAIVNHSRRYPADDELVHAYVVIGDTAYDALGAWSLEEASDVSPERYTPLECDKDNDCVNLWTRVDADWFERHHQDFDLGRLKAAQAYIRRHSALFPDRAGPPRHENADHP